MPGSRSIATLRRKYYIAGSTVDQTTHRRGAATAARAQEGPGVDPALAIQLLKRQITAGALGVGKKRPPAPVVPPPKETKPPIAYPAFSVKK